MIKIGDKAYYFVNIEDIMSLRVMEIMDVFEVSSNENYAKLSNRPFKAAFNQKNKGKYGEGTTLYGEY